MSELHNELESLMSRYFHNNINFYPYTSDTGDTACLVNPAKCIHSFSYIPTEGQSLDIETIKLMSESNIASYSKDYVRKLISGSAGDFISTISNTIQALLSTLSSRVGDVSTYKITLSRPNSNNIFIETEDEFEFAVTITGKKDE